MPRGDTTASRDADDVALLVELWGRWRTACAPLGAEQLAAPSGIGQWTVRELVAHVASRGPVLVEALLDDPDRPEAAQLSGAADYFRAVSAHPDASGGVARRAVEYAAARSDDELRRAFDDVEGRFLDRLDRSREWVVQSPGGPIVLRDFLQTRIVEGTVHLIDLLRAVDGDVTCVPPAALRRALDPLIDLAPHVELLDLATGRSSASPFPVLR